MSLLAVPVELDDPMRSRSRTWDGPRQRWRELLNRRSGSISRAPESSLPHLNIYGINPGVSKLQLYEKSILQGITTYGIVAT